MYGLQGGWKLKCYKLNQNQKLMVVVMIACETCMQVDSIITSMHAGDNVLVTREHMCWCFSGNGQLNAGFYQHMDAVQVVYATTTDTTSWDTTM